MLRRRIQNNINTSSSRTSAAIALLRGGMAKSSVVSSSSSLLVLLQSSSLPPSMISTGANSSWQHHHHQHRQFFINTRAPLLGPASTKKNKKKNKKEIPRSTVTVKTKPQPAGEGLKKNKPSMRVKSKSSSSSQKSNRRASSVAGDAVSEADAAISTAASSLKTSPLNEKPPTESPQQLQSQQKQQKMSQQQLQPQQLTPPSPLTTTIIRRHRWADPTLPPIPLHWYPALDAHKRKHLLDSNVWITRVQGALIRFTSGVVRASSDPSSSPPTAATTAMHLDNSYQKRVVIKDSGQKKGGHDNSSSGGDVHNYNSIGSSSSSWSSGAGDGSHTNKSEAVAVSGNFGEDLSISFSKEGASASSAASSSSSSSLQSMMRTVTEGGSGRIDTQQQQQFIDNTVGVSIPFADFKPPPHDAPMHPIVFMNDLPEHVQTNLWTFHPLTVEHLYFMEEGEKERMAGAQPPIAVDSSPSAAAVTTAFSLTRAGTRRCGWVLDLNGYSAKEICDRYCNIEHVRSGINKTMTTMMMARRTDDANTGDEKEDVGVNNAALTTSSSVRQNSLTLPRPLIGDGEYVMPSLGGNNTEKSADNKNKNDTNDKKKHASHDDDGQNNKGLQANGGEGNDADNVISSSSSSSSSQGVRWRPATPEELSQAITYHQSHSNPTVPSELLLIRNEDFFRLTFKNAAILDPSPLWSSRQNENNNTNNDEIKNDDEDAQEKKKMMMMMRSRSSSKNYNDDSLRLIGHECPTFLSVYNAQETTNPFLLDRSLCHRHALTGKPMPLSLIAGLTSAYSIRKFTNLKWISSEDLAMAQTILLRDEALSTNNNLNQNNGGENNNGDNNNDDDVQASESIAVTRRRSALLGDDDGSQPQQEEGERGGGPAQSPQSPLRVTSTTVSTLQTAYASTLNTTSSRTTTTINASNNFNANDVNDDDPLVRAILAHNAQHWRPMRDESPIVIPVDQSVKLLHISQLPSPLLQQKLHRRMPHRFRGRTLYPIIRWDFDQWKIDRLLMPRLSELFKKAAELSSSPSSSPSPSLLWSPSKGESSSSSSHVTAGSRDEKAANNDGGGDGNIITSDGVGCAANHDLRALAGVGVTKAREREGNKKLLERNRRKTDELLRRQQQQQQEEVATTTTKISKLSLPVFHHTSIAESIWFNVDHIDDIFDRNTIQNLREQYVEKAIPLALREDDVAKWRRAMGEYPNFWKSFHASTNKNLNGRDENANEREDFLASLSADARQKIKSISHLASTMPTMGLIGNPTPFVFSRRKVVEYFNLEQLVYSPELY